MLCGVVCTHWLCTVVVWCAHSGFALLFCVVCIHGFALLCVVYTGFAQLCGVVCAHTVAVRCVVYIWHYLVNENCSLQLQRMT